MTIKMTDILAEDRKYEYGCVMLYFDFPQMNKIHDAIDPKDIYEDPEDDSFGLEDEPHVTLLFGLHKEVTDEDVKGILDKFTFKPIKIKELSFFDNPKYDVLKFSVDGGGNLGDANEEFKKLPYTSDYPDYHPHMTIAYLKPKTAQKWIDKLSNQEFTLVPKFAKFSKPSKSSKKFKISVSK